MVPSLAVGPETSTHCLGGREGQYGLQYGGRCSLMLGLLCSPSQALVGVCLSNKDRERT